MRITQHAIVEIPHNRILNKNSWFCLPLTSYCWVLRRKFIQKFNCCSIINSVLVWPARFEICSFFVMVTNSSWEYIKCYLQKKKINKDKVVFGRKQRNLKCYWWVLSPIVSNYTLKFPLDDEINSKIVSLRFDISRNWTSQISLPNRKYSRIFRRS